MCIISVYWEPHYCGEQSQTMYAQRLNITLPYELARDFKRAVPAKARSKYIAGILKENITKKKNLKADWIKSFKAQKKIIEEIREDFKYADAEVWEKLP